MKSSTSNSLIDHWYNLTAPVKALLIGGTAFGLLLFTCCGGCLSLAFFRNSSDDDSMDRGIDARLADVKKEVDKADRVWNGGDKQQAVELYGGIMHDWNGKLYLDQHPGEFSRVASRVIDYKFANYGPEAARDDIELAAQMHVAVTVTTPEGNEFVAKVRQEYRQRNQKAAERTGNSSSATVDVKLVMKLKPGMSEDEVKAILGEPHKVKVDDSPAIPEANLPALHIVTWTYNPDADGWIVLAFKNGALEDGGSGGWDIQTGLIIPDKMKRILEDARQM